MVENHHLGAIFWIATAWIGPPMISEQTPEINDPPPWLCRSNTHSRQ